LPKRLLNESEELESRCLFLLFQLGNPTAKAGLFTVPHLILIRNAEDAQVFVMPVKSF